MMDFKTLVLNPEWISQGIYKIINWANNRKQDRHSVSLSGFSKIFENETNRFPIDKHIFLFELMKCYELAYETEKKNHLIIPHLLHKDKPAVLPDFPVGNSLMLRYKAEKPLPPNTISRFIVRHNEAIKKEKNEFLVWRYGVVLEDGKGSVALVREDDRMISVAVKGQEQTAFLDELRKTLNDIFNSYKSQKPELQYRIERFGQIPENKELWLQDSKIYKHYVNNRLYYDEFSDRNMSMQPVVDNNKISIENLFIDGPININIHININTIPDDLRLEIEKIIPQITAIAEVLFDEREEILAEVQQINAQLHKNHPKIPKIHTSFQYIDSILCGIAGNIATEPLKQVVKTVIEKLG
jgi:hypothetical protein